MIRCDEEYCDEVANTTHFVPSINNCEEVLFACRNHDFGGYWIRTSELFGKKRQHWINHIGVTKREGRRALDMLRDRVGGRWAEDINPSTYATSKEYE